MSCFYPVVSIFLICCCGGSMIVYRHNLARLFSSVLLSYQTEWKLVGSVCSAQLSQALGLRMLTSVIARLLRGHLATQGTFGPWIEDIFCRQNCHQQTFEEHSNLKNSNIILSCHCCPCADFIYIKQLIVMDKLASSPNWRWVLIFLMECADIIFLKWFF